MCKVLRIPRSTYYYEVNKLNDREKENLDEDVTEKINQIFNTNRRCFGTRRIKIALDKQGLKVSRRRIGRIMRTKNLVSTYTSRRYRVFSAQPNEHNITNGLGRAFYRERPREVLVSDLTYVKVAGKWHYICLFIDLFNREIVG
ncbi:hypothetical protein GCM10007190_16670 [Macrococcus hajekii]|nr:hypothetical protein GCM10007190_16670 [Macrococcus hajekii]